MQKDRIGDKFMKTVNKIILKQWQTPIDCVVLAESVDWILANNLFDYFIDGYALIPQKKIKEKICSEREQFTKKVLLANNQISSFTQFPIPLTTNELFAYFKKTESIIQICFKDESYVYIGKITKLLPHSFYLQTINTKGVWDKSENLIRYNSVYKIDFDTNYISSLTNYMNSLLE